MKQIYTPNGQISEPFLLIFFTERIVNVESEINKDKN